MLRRFLLALIVLVVIEQVTLQIIERAILRSPAVVERFIQELPHEIGFELQPRSVCREYPILVIYEYKICAEAVRGRTNRMIRIQFPSGYLTLIPRDYLDRYVFDGRDVAILRPGGSLEWARR